jgi:hypothetical protein
MFVFREVLNCKPGKVRPMVEKFKVIGDAIHEAKLAVSTRVFTDVSGEPFWTVVAEIEVETIEAFFEMEQKLMTNAAVGKAMADYHDLVVSGRREILRVEAVR